MRPNVVATMRANCAKLGVLNGTIDAWMSDVVAPWFDALEAHLGDGYLLERPSLADRDLWRQRLTSSAIRSAVTSLTRTARPPSPTPTGCRCRNARRSATGRRARLIR